MSPVAPTLQLFFTERMARQLQARPRTVVSYRDPCRLLLRFAAGRTGKAPSALEWQDLDAEMISAFRLCRIFLDGSGGVTVVRLRVLAWLFYVVCGVSA